MFATHLKFQNDAPAGNHWINKYYVTNAKCKSVYNPGIVKVAQLNDLRLQ